MNPVLLTGATGFIGQRLQKLLLDGRIPVTAIVRPSSKNRNTLQAGADCLTADLGDSGKLLPAISQASAVIYCAGSVRGRTLDDFKTANVDGVLSVVKAMNRSDAGVPLLLFSSLAASRPHVSDYANSKFLGEQQVRNHAKFPWTIFRPPAVYGPGDREMLPVLKLARRGLVMPPGPREQKLSLIHVDDLAAATLAWLNNWKKCVHQVFTMDDGHGGGYDWNEIASSVSRNGCRRINIPAWILFGSGYINMAASRLLNYAPMLTPGKARELTQTDWVCNNTDLNIATGWTPEISLEKGIQSLFGPMGGRQQQKQGDSD
jgi:nucleoside-diphosphate-sugar epimerase